MKEYSKFYVTKLEIKIFNVTYLYDGTVACKNLLCGIIDLKNVQNPEWFTLLKLLNFLKNITGRHIFQEFDLVIKSQTLFTCCYEKGFTSHLFKVIL